MPGARVRRRGTREERGGGEREQQGPGCDRHDDGSARSVTIALRIAS